jgi:hypothetical protein
MAQKDAGISGRRSRSPTIIFESEQKANIGYACDRVPLIVASGETQGTLNLYMLAENGVASQ